ncbi:TetR/AcrR family transcriptional regulator [Stagnihabitans tardus]|uniref:TetR family transcriptional regulator n=1 Tax=Stagnihabitans tardus TaxID=2699202 RepID=A0AAE5BUT1_9RHOB|nr:TetR/AcrR family transcriptional regulator [Stagnihabitans tardus]NBZ88221.1 TetR family transcriptional regulator [Stagnihabitans tardus]
MSKVEAPSKVEGRRAELRETLVALAEAQIVQGGMSSVKARDLAGKAGCAVGAIYNVFPDMTALIMAVNLRTFLRIGVEVAGAVVGHEALAPERRLVLLARAYLRFADQNHHLWKALFDLEMPRDSDVPPAYNQALEELFDHIARPVSELFQELDPDGVQLMARTLFSSVHGIVSLGLQNRLSGVPLERVEAMIEALLLRVAKT